MEPHSHERFGDFAARETSLVRREQVVAAREHELCGGWPLRRVWWALRLAPLTAVELLVAGAIFVAAFALGGAWLAVAAALGAVVIVLSCVSRLLGVRRPR